MSVYRRFISYMYDCGQDRSKKNCGFLKIEVRNNRCIIIFQLNNAPCQNICNVYLCFQDTRPQYHFLQSIPIQKGSTRYKIETDSLHMTEGNYTFSQCIGILCTDEKGGNCCTCWDSAKVLPKYEPHKTQKPVVKPSSAPEDEPVIETAIKPEPTPEKTPAAEPKLISRSFSELWEHMQQEFPSMDPFEDNAVVESIKIAPSDLGYLQACNLDLGSNQFMLHGYKCYHHLLMGRLRGQMQYVLGIPGVYDPQEQFMAKMFGFPCFKPIRECKQKNGQFGYWLRCFH